MEDIEKKIEEEFKMKKNKPPKEDSEIKRINKEKGRIAELMREGYSEEAAEEKARREDSEDAQEGE